MQHFFINLFPEPEQLLSFKVSFKLALQLQYFTVLNIDGTYLISGTYLERFVFFSSLTSLNGKVEMRLKS